MTDPLPRYRVLNVAGRPLELHLTAGVVVLPPADAVVCDAPDVDVPQVQALRRSGALVIRTVEPEPPAPPPKPPRRKPAARRRASGSGRKPSPNRREAR
jgi:hypothetical protein